MNPAVVAALIAAGTQIVSGAVEKSKGKKRAAGNVRPELGNIGVSDKEGLVDLFGKQAQYGLDPSSMMFTAGKSEDALESTIQSMLLAGGGPNAMVNAYRGFTDSMSDLGVMDAEKRWQKIQHLAPITNSLVDAKLQRFLYDKDAPYKDTAAEASLAQREGYIQMMQGFDTAAATAIKGFSNPYKTPEEDPTKTTVAGQLVTNAEEVMGTGTYGVKKTWQFDPVLGKRVFK